MTFVFHCYEFLLLKRLEEDQLLWNKLKSKITSEKDLDKNITPDLWFLAITLEKTVDRFPAFVRRLLAEDLPAPSSDNLLAKYLNGNRFVELHLDSIFKYGDGSLLPREIFRCCPNVRALSLKYNFLENLPPDIGRLQKLQYLALTNNRLQNSSIPYTLIFCRYLEVLLLDNNLLDALPGFLLSMPKLRTVHRHGNHNYFKATFMWYHTDVNDRILAVDYSAGAENRTVPVSPQTLQFLAAQTVIATKINYFATLHVPHVLMDYISDLYFKFNICGNCPKAKLLSESGGGHAGFKVFTFKNPYLGNTCVPFQHWACCLACAEEIEIPARVEQIRSSREQDMEYDRTIRAAQDRCSCRQKGGTPWTSSCSIL